MAQAWTPSAPVAVSPPQQARSRATRRRLLDATVACLVDLGLPRTSTTEVGRRAGVSQGALFKHFPSKALLLAAAVEHLFAGLIAEFRAGLGEVDADGRDPIREAVGILWRIFQEPGLLAAYELYLAARTDPDLRAALEPVLRRHRDALREEARRLFPEAAVRPDFDASVDGILNTLQGAALGAIPLDDPVSERAHLLHVETVARHLLETDGRGPARGGAAARREGAG